MRYAGFFVLLFLLGENLSFFATANDIDDGNLSIFEGGVENNGDEFLIIDGVPDNVNVVVLAVDINDGLKASIFDISCFGDMFEFIDAIVVLCNLRLSSWMVRRCSEPTLFVACSASTTTMVMATTRA